VQREGFSASSAGTLGEAREQLWKQVPDLVLTDLVLPDGRGTDLLADLDSGARAQLVVITGHASVDTAVDALRMGATDYLTKPIDVSRLKIALANAARTLDLEDEVGKLREKLRALGCFGSLVGVSPAMQRTYDLIGKVAPTEATILITGESGTGKDLVAQTVHDLSRRRKGPYLPVNCGAIAANLIESELFGHERGSFTGADRMHRGYFERASGGTLFLDEITETPIELQVKLLRVLETSTIMRVGGEQPTEIDARIIAATNRCPEEEVANGKLRQDLLYRLKVFGVHLPPLRERGNDILLLAEHFLDNLNKANGSEKRFATSTVDCFRRYPWPGNVRELKNVVHHAFILAAEEIGPENLPAELGSQPRRAEVVAVPKSPGGDLPPYVSLPVGTPIEEAERQLIYATLRHCDGNKSKAAQKLGICLKTLYNRLNSYKSDGQEQ